MDKNQGYAILKAVMLENGRGFALGEHPRAPSPFVTWACYDDEHGARQYEWGHYGSAPDEIVNYDKRVPVEGGAFLAWGHLTYTKPLTEKQAADYELRPAPEVSGLLREGRPRPIAEQMKEAARLAGERQAPSAPKRDAPDRGGR